LKPPSLGARKIFFENRMLHIFVSGTDQKINQSNFNFIFIGLMIASQELLM
jgi:hypothetical protein